MFSGLLSRLLFEDARPLIEKSRSRLIEPEDALPLPAFADPRREILDESRVRWEDRWSLLLSLLKTARPELGPILGLRLLAAGLGLLSPFLIHRLIGRISDGMEAQEAFLEAAGIAVFLGLAGFLAGLFRQHHFFRELKLLVIYQNLLKRRIYDFSLRLSQEARMRTPVGDIVNHMGADSDTLADIAIFFPDVIASTFLIVGAVSLLFHFIGVSALGAIALMLLITPFTQKATNRFTSLDEVLMKHRDRRITLMSQVLNSIRVVKYFVWEKSVEREVGAIREQELESRRQVARAVSIASTGFSAVPTLVLFVALAIHVWRGQVLDVATIFSCVALFSLLEEPFGSITHSISNLANALVAAGRITGFLRQQRAPGLSKEARVARKVCGVKVEGLAVRYEDQERTALQGVSFQVPAGASLAVVGGVGGGKSTLLHAILGELAPAEGAVRFDGGAGRELQPRTAYVSQEAFIINGSLRQNILFGRENVSEERLREALRVSCLEKDLEDLPAGLETEIGEKGVNLSGGQKQRVSLARAFLQDPDLVLLDDPLSAVDVETEQALVDRLIFGAWSGRTRIASTHRLESLARFDRILVLENGVAVAQGTYDELLRDSAEFRDFIRQHQSTQGGFEAAASEVKGGEPQKGSRITVDEDRETGAVKGAVYWDYLKALGGSPPLLRTGHLTLLFLSAVAVALAPLAQRSWLAKAPGWEVRPWTLVLVYGALGLLTLALTLVNRIYWLERAIRAGRDFHDRMLRSVLRSPIRFFDSTPVGRVLQRFSRDVESVDAQLQWSFTEVIFHGLSLVVAFGLIIAVLPWVVVLLVPVLVVYYFVQLNYRRAAREVKRFDSVSRSPVYAHFKETLQGLVVIRGFARSDWFLQMFYKRLATQQRMFYTHFLLNRWFSTRIPLIGACITAGTGVGVAFAARQELVSPGVAGLLVTYALSFWQYLNWCVRILSDVEARMTSVERLNFFASLPAEKDTQGPVEKGLESWPSRGRVVFENVRARYAAHLPLVLKGVSFEVEPGTRVGFVGRTGSGKSTLFQALFRFIEVEGGRILIDGIDISRVPLAKLRGSLAIIPQDPTLFLGTIRSNLDRYSEYSDVEIRGALKKASLLDFVRGLPGGLENEVVEGGLNLSQGQRQLLCLARALLVRAQVIVLDEATASVDVATDVLLQRVLRESFQGVTQLIIAHRLGTVRDCDQVIEIADGLARERETLEELEVQ